MSDDLSNLRIICRHCGMPQRAAHPSGGLTCIACDAPLGDAIMQALHRPEAPAAPGLDALPKTAAPPDHHPGGSR
jgi:hypothetical protein